MSDETSSRPPGYQVGWVPQLLPFMGEEGIWRAIDFVNLDRSFLSAEELAQLDDASGAADEASAGEAAEDTQNLAMGAMGEMGGMGSGRRPGLTVGDLPELQWLHCPSSATSGSGLSSYAGCQNSVEKPIDVDSDGLLYLNSSESLESIHDGASCTLLAGEHRTDSNTNGWIYGDRGTLRNGGRMEAYSRSGVNDSTGLVGDYSSTTEEERKQKLLELQLKVGTFGSNHGYHVGFVFADGAVRFLSRQISTEVLANLINRKDSQGISASEF